jgi:hypothetical protein
MINEHVFDGVALVALGQRSWLCSLGAIAPDQTRAAVGPLPVDSVAAGSGHPQQPYQRKL